MAPPTLKKRGCLADNCASAAQISALLSAIADIQIRLDRALTGYVNQLGEIQAIGGVNEKIKGFYKKCRDKGLTGPQGMIIPKANIHNLILNEELIETV